MIRTALSQHKLRLASTTLLSATAAGLNIFLLDYLHGIAQLAETGRLGDWLPTYFGGVALLFGFALGANLLLVYLACTLVAQLRETLVRQILGSRYADRERAGKGVLLASLTDDIENMSEGMVVGPQFLFNIVTILLCLGYLLYLSPHAFVFFFVVLCLGVALTMLIVTRGNRYFERYRKLKDHLYEHFHAMFDGAKELAIDDKRLAHFVDRQLVPAIGRLKQAELKREIYWNIGETWTRVFLFLALGVAVIATRHSGAHAAALTMSYFIVITFIAGPIESVVSAVSTMAKARHSARIVSGLDFPPEPTECAPAPIPAAWQQIRFDAVGHTSVGQQQDETFTLGPVSLTIRRGETLFLTGGNGSGKSTFGKLLVGLYQRSSGQLYVDDVAQARQPGAAYRALFSTVFSDYYLFPSLLDKDGVPAAGAGVDAGLARLALGDKVKFEDGLLSTTALSQGQRKRLALLQSWLSDTPVYLYDEWAADQDPGARDDFYRQILPAMKSEGKTLVVITHDDRYFDLADRVVKFEAGRIASVRTPATVQAVVPLGSARLHSA